MKINFRQGIVSYQPGGSPGSPAFLQRVGDNVSLLTTNKPFTVTVAHRDTDYLHSEDVTINNAWSGSFSTGDHWLYMDFNLLTFARTFGVTTVEPVAQITEPSSPTTGLMWYNTSTNRHFVYNGASWSEVLRVLVAQISNGTFISPSINGGSNYAGTQVGNTNTVFAGRILFDESSNPISRDNGTFFTTEDAFFTNQSRIDALRLESNVARAQTAGGSLAAFQVVAWTDDGKISSATYDDVGNTVVGILTEDVVPTAPGTPPENAGSPAVTSTNDRSVGAVIVQGVVTNPAWDWTASVDVGSALWVDNSGSLVTTDPHVSDPLTYTTKRVPVARVLSADTIIFEQGLGGVGPTGPRGPSATATAATTSTLGSVVLSYAPSNPSAPIAVETNDPRMTDARVPLTHNHNAENILLTPTGNIISTDVQTAFAEVDAEKVAIAGDTMTGFLTLSADPTANLHAATKQYVDTEIAGIPTPTVALNDVTDVVVAGSPLVSGQSLVFNGINWTNQTISGGSGGAFTLDGSENLYAGTSVLGGGGINNNNNFVAGYNAGYDFNASSNNIVIGQYAGEHVQSDSNVFIGPEAGRSGGYGHFGATLTGSLNVGIGPQALSTINGTDTQNVAVGPNTLSRLVGGNNNIGIGSIVGRYQVQDMTGNHNVLLGSTVGIALTSGGYNIAIGDQTFSFNTTGSFNVCIGKEAGSRLYNGDNNVCIGSYAGPTSTSGIADQLFIDNQQTNTPLLHGDFSVRIIDINGTLEENGWPVVTENEAPLEYWETLGFGLGRTEYTGNLFTLTSQISIAKGFAYNDDGLKMYVVDNATDDIFEYDLDTAYDVSTATYNGSTVSLTGTYSYTGIAIDPTGTYAILGDSAFSSVHLWTMGTPWDISSATETDIESSNILNDVTDLYVRADGFKMYTLSGSTDTIYQYTLGTGWDTNTVTYDSVSFNLNTGSPGISSPTSFKLDDTGTKLFVLNAADNSIYEFELTTAWDISTAKYTSISFDPSSQNTNMTYVAFNTDGSKLVAIGTAGGTDRAYEYNTPLTGFISATTEQDGVIEIATQGEVNTGTDGTRAVTPLTLKNWSDGGGVVNLQITSHAYFDAEVANTTAVSIDWTTGNKQSVAPAAGSPAAGPIYIFTDPDGPTNLILKATNLGATTPIWPGTVLWPGGVEPTWTVSGTDIISFYFDGTNYYGMAGLAFA